MASESRTIYDERTHIEAWRNVARDIAREICQKGAPVADLEGMVAQMLCASEILGKLVAEAAKLRAALVEARAGLDDAQYVIVMKGGPTNVVAAAITRARAALANDAEVTNAGT